MFNLISFIFNRFNYLFHVLVLFNDSIGFGALNHVASEACASILCRP